MNVVKSNAHIGANGRFVLGSAVIKWPRNVFGKEVFTETLHYVWQGLVSILIHSESPRNVFCVSCLHLQIYEYNRIRVNVNEY